MKPTITEPCTTLVLYWEYRSFMAVGLRELAGEEGNAHWESEPWIDF